MTTKAELEQTYLAELERLFEYSRMCQQGIITPATMLAEQHNIHTLYSTLRNELDRCGVRH